MNKKMSLVNAVLSATILVSIFVLVITITGELYKPLKNLLTEIHSHHWIGKGIWAAILFCVATASMYPLFNKIGDKYTQILPILTVYALSTSSILLIIFFLYEYAIKH